MQAIYDFLYEPGLPLKIMGILVGAWLVASHVFALLKPDVVKPFLQDYPRNEKIGIPLVIFCFAWGYIIWTCMDLGDFFVIERYIQLLIIGVAVGVCIYVREFVAVRALGFLMILAAAPMLESAFLEEPTSRLLLVIFAYAIAVKGMFWVGMPYLMRDQIKWVLADDRRYKVGCAAGAAYGLAMLGCAVAFW